MSEFNMPEWSPQDEHRRWIERLRAQLVDPRPVGDVDLYQLAMTLRGNANGSADGTAGADELVLMFDVLTARVEHWADPRGVASDAALLQFFVCVLAETSSIIQRLRDSAIVAEVRR